MKRVALILLLLGVVACLSAESYTVEELFTRALQNDSELTRLEALSTQALTRIRDARGSFLPRLKTGFTAAYTSELPEMEQSTPMGTQTIEAGVKDTYAASLSASQLIFAGFARSEALALAENNRAASIYRKELRGEALRFAILQASYAYTLSDLAVESLKASLARLEINRTRIESFFRQGLASELEVVEVEASITELELNLRAQEAEKTAALIRLEELSGLTGIREVSIDEEYLKVPEELGRDADPALLSANGRYLLYDYRLKGHEIDRRLETGAFYPTVRAFGALNYGRPGANFFDDQWQFYYTGGVELSLELYSGGTRRNALDRNAAEKEATLAEREKLLKELVSAARRSEEALVSLSDQYRTAETLYRQKERRYRLVQQLWQAGQKSSLDSLAAEQELTAADITRSSLRIRLLSTYQEYLQLINQPLWDELN